MDKKLITPAIRTLQNEGVEYVSHPYKYRDKGGAKLAAIELKVDEYLVVKTLVFEEDKKNAFIVLMHGNKEVSTKKLTRHFKQKKVRLCSPQKVNKLTGYVVGGTSPFATRVPLPVYIEKSILDLQKIWINAGKRGLLIEIFVCDLVRLLNPVPVEVAQ